MALHLHRAQRSDALVAGLADVLSDPLDDPSYYALVPGALDALAAVLSSSPVAANL